MQQKYYRQKQAADADCQQYDSRIDHMHAQYWQENSLLSDVCVCAQLHFNLRKEMGVKLDKERWYQHVPESADTGHSSKVNRMMESATANRPNCPKQ